MAESNDFDLYGDLYDDVEEVKPDIKPILSSPPTSTSAIPSYSDNNNSQHQQPQQQQQQQPHQFQVGTAQNPAPIHYDPGFGGKPAILGTTKPNDMPEEGKMFVGGLNWDTTDEGLKAYFEQFGKITHCTIMRDGETARSRGFAFMTFESGTSVNAVMAREHYLDGKTIDPKRAIPRENGGAKTDKLFVRSIPNSCTQESFRAYWRGFGNITDATLMMDKESGRHRGFGFVNYENSEAVEAVLKGGPHVMDGQTLEVKRAQTKSEAPAFQNNNMNNNNNNMNNNRNYNNNNNNNQQQSYNNNPSQSYSNAPLPNPGAGGVAGFDPATMAKFFQQMGWGAWNPMMMGGGAPGGMPGGMGMMGMPGMGGIPGMPMPMPMPGMGGMGMNGGMGGMGRMGGMGGMMGGSTDASMGMYGAGPGAAMTGITGADGSESGIPGGGVSAWTAPMNGGNMMSNRGGPAGFRGGFQNNHRGGGAGRGGRGGGDTGLPTGPASMRGASAGPEGAAEGGAGPTRSRGGGAGFHPYAR